MPVQIKGTTKLLIKSAQGLPDAIAAAAVIGLDRGLQVAVATIQLKHLSGPRPKKLDRLTGRLRQSITHRVDRAGTNVSGQAGTNVKYAAYHEFGFHGVVNVKAHTRIVDERFTFGEAVQQVKAH